MKTYKEMAENVLRRRDEYEEKKEHRYGVVKRTAAIAVTVVFVLSAMIVGPIVGRIMKEQQNQPADVTKINTDTETTADQDTETTKPADVTTEVGETTGETDISEKYIILKKAEEKHSPDITNGLNIELKDIIEESEKQSYNINDGDMIGVLHSDVCRYELQMSEDYNEDYEKWVVLILPDDNIEMVSPKERYFYHENDKTEKYQSVNIEFRYKAGKTNGSISVYMFAGDYGIKRFEDNFKGVENPIISTSNSLYDVMETYYFAQVKGYDCWSISCTYIYQQAAIYFGDVDENGVPLYMKNPYLEDYYDNPWCEEKRDEESNGETTGEIDETTEKNKFFLPIEYLPDPNPAITLEVTESSESSPFVRYYGYDKSEIKTYQMRYNNTTYFNSMSMNGEGSHGNYVKIIITSSENIEMLTDNYLVLEIPGATADFELSFKCINGATNGFFTIYWIEDTHDYYDEIDENTDIDAFRLELRKNGRKEYISRENRTYGFANVKGYDIFAKCETVDHIYSVVARYFGEVDANGVPLYLNDPYMPDYYDSLHSQNDRLIKEKYSTNEERSGSTDELESDGNSYI